MFFLYLNKENNYIWFEKKNSIKKLPKRSFSKTKLEKSRITTVVIDYLFQIDITKVKKSFCPNGKYSIYRIKLLYVLEQLVIRI